MTATPHLGRRVVLVGLAVVVLVLLVVDLFVFIALRAELNRSLDAVLADRAAVARSQASRLPADELAARLQELGIGAVVRTGDGTTYRAEPPSPEGGGTLPASEDDRRVASTVVVLPDGGEVVVFVPTSGRDRTLRQLLLLEVVGSLAALALAGALLYAVSRVALRPVAVITAAATRTAGGREGERIRPDRPYTTLGRMASAYDTMLDALETAVQEERTAQSDLSQALQDLRTAADDARRSEETTRRFLADAAHQLRTPIAGIRACAETLLRGGSREDHDRLLATMVRETSRAGRLVSSLLLMARLDQGQPLVEAEVDVVALVAGEVERVDLLAPSLDVGLSAPPGSAGRWWLPEPALREIVSNLLDNARRHARSRVDVAVDRDGDTITIRVADDGPGVAPADRERVFERFVSLDGLGGAGLGLAVARSAARAMGGDVRYEGAFVVTVPVSTVPPRSAGDGSREPAAAG